MGGGGDRGLNLPLPVPFNPGSRPVLFGSPLFAFFQSQNIVQCWIIFPYFSRFPPRWESRFPPPLLPPPVHFPPPFLPVSRPPVPPPCDNTTQSSESNRTLFVSNLAALSCPSLQVVFTMCLYVTFGTASFCYKWRKLVCIWTHDRFT